MGSLCTILILVITVVYSIQKLAVLNWRKDVDILSAVNSLVFTSEDKFTHANGFNIAVAFTEYNYNQEWELEPRYGSLVVNSFSWGVNPDGSFFTRRIPMQTQICTKE